MPLEYPQYATISLMMKIQKQSDPERISKGVIRIFTKQTLA